MKQSKLLYLFIFIFFLDTTLFAQSIVNNIKPSNSLSNLSQEEKDERLWDIVSTSELSEHDIAEANLLIKSGANVNYIHEDYHWNLLFLAIRNENYIFVEPLIKAGCDVNYISRTYDYDEDTEKKVLSEEECLVYFALYCDCDFSIIKTLCENGSSVTFIDQKNEKNILYEAFNEGYKKEDILYLLHKGASPVVKNTSRSKIIDGFIPIFEAVATGDIDLVKEFMKYGAKLDVYSKYSYGCALNAAVYSENMEMVQFCLDNGCSPKNIPSTMWSPLDYAISNLDEPMAKLFINLGVDIDRINKELGETNLMNCLQNSDFGLSDNYSPAHLASCHFALKMGANPLMKNEYGDTVIQLAITKGTDSAYRDMSNCLEYLDFASECIKVVKAKGYEPNLKESLITNDIENVKKNLAKINNKKLKILPFSEKVDYDPFYYEAFTNSSDCVQILFDNGYYPKRNAVIQNIISGNLQTLELYYKNNVDFNNYDNKDRSLFSRVYFASDNSEKCLDYIFTHGYDVNKMVLDYNNDEITNIGYFVSNYSEDIINVLIKNGADVNKPFGKEQITPLMKECDSSIASSRLLKLGADIFAQDINGRTIFERTSSNNISREIQENIDSTYMGKYYVATDNLNLRSYYYLDSSKIGKISKGEKIWVEGVGRYEEIDGIKSFWVKVDAEAGEGWCFAGYLKEF